MEKLGGEGRRLIAVEWRCRRTYAGGEGLTIGRLPKVSSAG